MSRTIREATKDTIVTGYTKVAQFYRDTDKKIATIGDDLVGKYWNGSDVRWKILSTIDFLMTSPYNTKLYDSTDGENFTELTGVSMSSWSYYPATYINGYWYQPKQSGGIQRSSDKKAWTSVFTSGIVFSKIVGNSQSLLAKGTTGDLYYSTDGTSWAHLSAVTQTISSIEFWKSNFVVSYTEVEAVLVYEGTDPELDPDIYENFEYGRIATISPANPAAGIVADYRRDGYVNQNEGNRTIDALSVGLNDRLYLNLHDGIYGDDNSSVEYLVSLPGSDGWTGTEITSWINDSLSAIAVNSSGYWVLRTTNDAVEVSYGSSPLSMDDSQPVIWVHPDTGAFYIWVYDANLDEKKLYRGNSTQSSWTNIYGSVTIPNTYPSEYYVYVRNK